MKKTLLTLTVALLTVLSPISVSASEMDDILNVPNEIRKDISKAQSNLEKKYTKDINKIIKRTDIDDNEKERLIKERRETKSRDISQLKKDEQMLLTDYYDYLYDEYGYIAEISDSYELLEEVYDSGDIEHDYILDEIVDLYVEYIPENIASSSAPTTSDLWTEKDVNMTITSCSTADGVLSENGYYMENNRYCISSDIDGVKVGQCVDITTADGQMYCCVVKRIGKTMFFTNGLDVSKQISRVKIYNNIL